MKGTEKQITWAQDIITTATNTIDHNIEITEQRITECGEFYAPELVAWKIVKAFIANALAAFGDDAAKIISKRNHLAGDSVIKMANRIANDIRSGKQSAEQIASALHVDKY